jgi:hypothetical protein
MQPLFFSSAACRAEADGFLARERALGRNDLILPIYYIDCDDFRPDSEDTLKAVLARRQYADWRKLRKATEADVDAAVSELASRIHAAFKRVQQQPRRVDSKAPAPAPVLTPKQPEVEAPNTATVTGPLTGEQRKMLAALLLSMFSSGEFLRFLRHSSDTAGVVNEIPNEGAAAIVVFTEAVEALDRQGLINESLFARLIGERPRRPAEIRAAAAKILGRP